MENPVGRFDGTHVTESPLPSKTCTGFDTGIPLSMTIGPGSMTTGAIEVPGPTICKENDSLSEPADPDALTVTLCHCCAVPVPVMISGSVPLLDQPAGRPLTDHEMGPPPEFATGTGIDTEAPCSACSVPIDGMWKPPSAERAIAARTTTSSAPATRTATTPRISRDRTSDCARDGPKAVRERDRRTTGVFRPSGRRDEAKLTSRLPHRLHMSGQMVPMTH